jgi:hypothetical protein
MATGSAASCRGRYGEKLPNAVVATYFKLYYAFVPPVRYDEGVTDSQHDRLRYIGLIGLAAIVPLFLGMYPIGAILSLVSVLFVILFIRSDRKRKAAQRGFPVIPKTPSSE